ncbi:polysaccharide pyruvyl transferase family protein [Aureibaculum marinum]|uniref:Polysaccharide pyruvyl transferase family protein n=1 Tax=Aureibaculum marinum TaxID=2487930 RepID=A0A3N4N6H4_9FLAO|nr:polysaccharide pyruvyl transferase family protein [Aureibaculum marinum]RPD91721.1 polysaccharide pyruvyl transferase family protein [Aureibaculum marinum]
MKKKILLTGYIGYKNFGDDLLFEIAINRIKQISNVEVSVVITNSSVDCEYLYQYYPDLILIKLNNTIPAFFYTKFDKVYYIGGGILFDYSKKVNTSKFIKKYISNIFRFKIPRLLGTQFGGIGIGIGPYFNSRSLILHKQILSSFQILGVRDNKSFEYAKEMNIKNLYLSNDLSIGYEKLPEDDLIDLSNEIIICPRSYHHKPEYEKHLNELIKFAEFLEENAFKTHWVFLQEDKEDLMKKITSSFKTTVWNPSKMSILSFISIFNNAEVVFSSRMHSLFIAGLVNTPFVAIELHPKLKYASELFYKNPIVISPLEDIEVYKNAFKNIKIKKFNKSNLENEKEILNNLDLKFFEWINN